MANRGVCSKNMKINGQKVSFATHAIWALDPDGKPFRVRHYRDLLRTGVFNGERTASFISSMGYRSHESALPVLALAKKDAPLNEAEIAFVLRWAEASGPGLQRSFEDGKAEAGLPNAVLGDTLDVRRATNVRIPADRITLGEGGWGSRRSPENELLMLARSDRSSDMFYESAKERGERRRNLVRTIVAKDPEKLAAILSVLRTKDGLRTPSLLVAVDAAMAGHPDAERLLESVMLRADEPGLVLRYFFDTYRNGERKRIPSSIRQAVASAAARLYTEDAVLRFDRRRNIGVEDRAERGRPVRFADVLALTHPTPRDDFQSSLFGFLAGTGAPTPLLAERARLAALPTELVVEELSAEAQRVATGGLGRGGVLSRLPWEVLASLTASGRADIALAEERLAEAKADRAAFRTDPANAPVLREERRLRSRVRDAARAAKDMSLEGMHERRSVALKELRAFRKSSEWKRVRDGQRAAAEKVDAARAHLSVTASHGGKVHPAVWGVALPSLSDNQLLSLLGAFDRSGIDEVTRSRARERLAAARVSIPDILRTARGATLAAAGPGAETLVGRGPGAWVGLPRSPWEGTLDTLAAERVAEKLPELKGRVLILVDGSGSMSSEVSGRRNDHRAAGYQSLTCADVAGFAAAAIASRCRDGADVYVYDTETIKVDTLSSGVVSSTRDILTKVRGGGTDTHDAIARTWQDHDLLVVLTDEQTSFVPGQRIVSSPYRENSDRRSFRLPSSAKMVTVNLAGYAGAHMDASENHRNISGWSEALFDEIAQLNAATPPGSPRPPDPPLIASV